MCKSKSGLNYSNAKKSLGDKVNVKANIFEVDSCSSSIKSI